MDPRQDRVEHDSESARLEREIDQTRARMDNTACAIQDRLTLRALSGDLVDLLASGAGIGSRRALKGIKDNPIPAALVGLGIAWLLADRTASGRARRAASDEYDEDHEGAPHEPGRVGQALRHGAQAAGDMAHRAGERISDAASSARQTVRDAASSVGETVRDAASSVRDTAANLTDKVRARAAQAGEQVSYMSGRAREMAQSARRGVVHTYEENPLILGAAAFAVGLVGGLAIPTCSFEDRVMGRASRKLKDRVKDMGEKAVQAGRDVAAHTAEAAKEGMGQGRTTGERIANAAEAAINTAAQEAAGHARTVAGTTRGADQRAPGHDAGADTGI